MRDGLREDAAAAAERGSSSAEHHEAFREAGFYRILQPRRYGGYQFGMGTFLRVIAEIGRGDPGSAWGLCLASGHALHLASFYPEEGQAELFGPTASSAARSARSPRPGGARPGGWRVSGRWDYCVGHHLVDALHGHGLRAGRADRRHRPARAGRGPRRLGRWADHRAERDRLEHRRARRRPRPGALRRALDWKEYDPDAHGGSPGFRLHGDPLYIGRILTFFMAELAAPMVGAVFAALDEYEHIAHTRGTSFPPRMPRTESSFVQSGCGEAMGCATRPRPCCLAQPRGGPRRTGAGRSTRAVHRRRRRAHPRDRPARRAGGLARRRAHVPHRRQLRGDARSRLEAIYRGRVDVPHPHRRAVPPRRRRPRQGPPRAPVHRHMTPAPRALIATVSVGALVTSCPRRSSTSRSRRSGATSAPPCWRSSGSRPPTCSRSPRSSRSRAGRASGSGRDASGSAP